MAEPEREGYIYLGSVGVDSGQLMICDPSYVLRDDEETQNAIRRLGLENVPEKLPTYQEATAVLDSARFGLLRNEIALLFHPGYGDDLYPVFGKFDEAGRIVEVIIDMNST